MKLFFELPEFPWHDTVSLGAFFPFTVRDPPFGTGTRLIDRRRMPCYHPSYIQICLWRHSYPERWRERPFETSATGQRYALNTVPTPAGGFWKMRGRYW